MNRKLVLILAGVVLAGACSRNQPVTNQSVATPNGQTESTSSLKPKGGYVPDEKTAIAIASAIWCPVFNTDNVEDQKPITAKLQDGVWVVSGRWRMGFDGHMTFMARISADDGRVIKVYAFT